MSALALVLGPALASGVAALMHPRARSALLLTVVAVIVAIIAGLQAVAVEEPVTFLGYFRVDTQARLFVAFVDPIFLGIAVYVWSRVATNPGLERALPRFVPCALLFLAACNAALLSQHLAVAWVALEVSTLAAAPLVAHGGARASWVAAWRYLVFSAVGLGLVLAGLLCIARALHGSGLEPELTLEYLAAHAAAANGVWGQLGVALVVLGLGTKLGLAPMYSWLPEAYDEAPPAVAALLGAVQFNATMAVLFRVLAAFRPTHGALLTRELVLLGLASMVVATIGLISTRNIKRLVAYASINHAGVIAIGLGIGAGATYGVLLYVVSNAIIKAILFMSAGKIEACYRTKDARQIAGLLKDLPYSGLYLMIGTFGLLGFPPFGSFFGELLILSSLVSSDHMLVFAAFCVLVTMTFVATGRTVFPMIWGEPAQRRSWPQQTLWQAWPKLVFLAALVALGVYIPRPIGVLFQQVAHSLEHSPQPGVEAGP